MRVRRLADVRQLGQLAQMQIKLALSSAGTVRTALAPVEKPNESEQSPAAIRRTKKLQKFRLKRKSRVMTTSDGLKYCPWPSSDPFVEIHKQLELRYGMYEHGGLLVTEMIINGGSKEWRFDFALVPRLTEISASSINGIPDKSDGSWFVGGNALLIEADGFENHRLLEAFKNDRAKQTHALKQGFVLKRITNQDARERLFDVMSDIDSILGQYRLYQKCYTVQKKGWTQSVFSWNI